MINDMIGTVSRDGPKCQILNTAGSYKLSSDRTIHEYARDMWRIELAVLPNVSREYKL